MLTIIAQIYVSISGRVIVLIFYHLEGMGDFMFKGLIIVMFFAVSFSAGASEEAEARKLCEQAMVAYQSELAEKGIHLSKESLSCQFNGRSLEYWACVVKKLKKGNSFDYSTNACGDAALMNEVPAGAASIFGAAGAR